jgi:hypothetical protein
MQKCKTMSFLNCHSTGYGSGLLKLTNRDKGTGVFVLPRVSESASFDNPHVSFHRVGEERFLSEIRMASETYYLPVSHSRITEAASKSRESPSVATDGSGNEQVVFLSPDDCQPQADLVAPFCRGVFSGENLAFRLQALNWPAAGEMVKWIMNSNICHSATSCSLRYRLGERVSKYY